MLFPNLPGERRRRAEQHIRQCRLGEVGHNVKMNRLERDGPAGTRQQLLASLLYFETGRSTLNEKGQQTIQDLASLLQEQQRAAPEMCFQLDLVGTASGRWRQTGGQSATDLNQQLSEQRVAQAENELRRRLPATALAAGIFQFDSRAEGSQLHQSLNLPPDDNSWIHRSVAVDVYATKRLP